MLEDWKEHMSRDCVKNKWKEKISSLSLMLTHTLTHSHSCIPTHAQICTHARTTSLFLSPSPLRPLSLSLSLSLAFFNRPKQFVIEILLPIHFPPLASYFFQYFAKIIKKGRSTPSCSNVQLIKCLTDRMFNWSNVQPIKCSTNRMFNLSNVQPIKCSTNRMFNQSNVQPIVCSTNRMFNQSNVQPIECSTNRMF